MVNEIQLRVSLFLFYHPDFRLYSITDFFVLQERCDDNLNSGYIMTRDNSRVDLNGIK